MAQFAVVQSGFTVSSGITLARSDQPFTIEVLSQAAVSLTAQFTSTDATAATSGQYGTLLRSDGTGAVYTAFSGSAPAWTAPVMPPTPWLRLVVSPAATTTRSFQILNVTQ